MGLIKFKNLPSLDTPLSAENFNNNFDYLDKKIDDFEDSIDSDWISPEITADFEYYNESGWCEYRKIGKVIHIRGGLKPKNKIAASNTMLPMFYLPEEFIPSKNEYAVCQGSGTNRWLLTVATNSSVGISRYSDGTAVKDIPSGAWLVFNITYFVD